MPTKDELQRLAAENFDLAYSARFYALRMRTPECALALHAFADFAFLEALAFQRAVRGERSEA